MSKRLNIYETLELHGHPDLSELAFESIVPACCEEGCEVEPDGTCEHGHPSILLRIGVI